MTDKERIEKLIQTLMIIKQILQHLDNMTGDQSMSAVIQEIRDAIEFAIQANADQIKLDL